MQPFFRCGVVPLLFLVIATLAEAQQLAPPAPQSRLLSMQPCGGKAGSTVEILLVGESIDDAESLHFSTPGLKAKRLREEIVPKTKGSPEKGKAKGPPSNSVARFEVTIPADCPLGQHDLRVVDRQGVSNPRSFTVGSLPEVEEVEPNNDPETATKITIGSTVSGAIGVVADVDFFQFSGKKGERVVVSCLTTSIDSRLHADLQLYDEQNRQLANSRDYLHNNALVDAVLPNDGTYFIRLSQFSYNFGGTDYFYRLTVSKAPWIDTVFPPMVDPLKPTAVTVYGRNLPGGVLDATAKIGNSSLEKLTVTIPPRKKPADHLETTGFLPPEGGLSDGYSIDLKNDFGTSNPFNIGYAVAPIVVEADANDTPETAQLVSVPSDIAGRVEKRRDRDYFRFAAKKGEVLSLEVLADRIGSPINPVLQLLRTDTGRIIETAAETTELLSQNQFYNRHNDPQRIRFTVPVDGEYLAMVTSKEAFTQASPRDVYRLRITAEQPDFRLFVMPASYQLPEGVNLAAGNQQFVNVYAWRKDGFTGPIELSAEGLPEGVKCPTAYLGAGLRHGVMVLSASEKAPTSLTRIQVKGTAVINGEKIIHVARPAGITWGFFQAQQQNQPMISRLERELMLSVRESTPFRLSTSPEIYRVTAGEKLPIVVKVERLQADFKAPIQYSAFGFATALTLVGGGGGNQMNMVAAEKNEFTATIDVKQTALPGKYTFVILGTATIEVARDAGGKQMTKASISAPSTPITIEILPKTLVNTKIEPENVKLKPGEETLISLKIERVPGFSGPLKLELTGTDAGKNLNATPVMLEVGKSEVVLKVNSDAKIVAGTAKIALKFTAEFGGGKTVTQEVKVNWTVTK